METPGGKVRHGLASGETEFIKVHFRHPAY
jgi:hypothetical protein